MHELTSRFISAFNRIEKRLEAMVATQNRSFDYGPLLYQFKTRLLACDAGRHVGREHEQTKRLVIQGLTKIPLRFLPVLAQQLLSPKRLY